jgi:hypothetical protein
VLVWVTKGTIAGLVNHQPSILSQLIEGLASNRFCQLSVRNILHLTNRTRSLKVDHVALMAKPSFEKVEHWLLDAGSKAFSL